MFQTPDCSRPCLCVTDCVDTNQARFNYEDSLTRHIQYEHEGAKWRYKCDRCGKLFKHNDRLKDHIRLDHEKAPLKCNEPGCDAVYLYSSGLRVHKNKIHKGIEISCTECDFKSYKKCLVKNHFENKHMNLTLECKHETCNYVTSSKVALQYHYYGIHKDLPKSKPKRRIDQLGEPQKERTLHKCDLCEFSAVIPFQLKMHKEDKHEGKNQCQECNKTYHNSYYLKKHKCIKMALETSVIKMESDNKIDLKYVSPIILKYPCPFCIEEFPTTQEMSSHLFSHDISK